MDQEVDRLNRYADELLADRRPTRAAFPKEHGLHARQAAALLSGIRPEAGIPSRRFLTRLEGRIAQWIREEIERPISRTRVRPRPVMLSALGGVASRLLNVPRLLWRARPFRSTHSEGRAGLGP
jgi:hypothetical protein